MLFHWLRIRPLAIRLVANGKCRVGHLLNGRHRSGQLIGLLSASVRCCHHRLQIWRCRWRCNRLIIFVQKGFDRTQQHVVHLIFLGYGDSVAHRVFLRTGEGLIEMISSRSSRNRRIQHVMFVLSIAIVASYWLYDGVANEFIGSIFWTFATNNGTLDCTRTSHTKLALVLTFYRPCNCVRLGLDNLTHQFGYFIASFSCHIKYNSAHKQCS